MSRGKSPVSPRLATLHLIGAKSKVRSAMPITNSGEKLVHELADMYDGKAAP